MLKILAIFAMLLAVSNSGKEKNGSSLPDNNSEKHPAPAVSFVNNETAYPNAEPAKQEPPRWYTMPEWWLCILGVPTLYYLIHQTKATKVAAKAAMLNAQAVIDAERAWIVVSIEEEFAPLPLGHGGMTEGRIIQENNRRGNEAFMANLKGEPKVFYVSCLNQGRTPARIISVCAAHLFIDRPENLPTPPDYSAPTRMPTQTFIVSRDSFRFQPGFSPRSVWENAREARSLKADDNFLIYYGRVVYEDILAFGGQGDRVQRESRWSFCCFMDSDDLPVRSGPGEYDRYT